MFDFFNEFLQSDLAKDNKIAFSVTAVLLLIVGAGLMWLFMSKIYMKSLENSVDELKKKNEKMESDFKELQRKFDQMAARHKALLESSDRLKFYDEQYVARNVDTTDPALDEFTDS